MRKMMYIIPLLILLLICAYLVYARFLRDNTSSQTTAMQQSEPTNKFYSVTWPTDWATNDVVNNSLAKDDFPNMLSYIGGRPDGQTTFYQHAIIVSEASKDELIAAVERDADNSNASRTEQREDLVNGQPAVVFTYVNNVDNTNKTTYYLLTGHYNYILKLHTPSTAPYLNESAATILNSFTVK